MPAVLVTAVFYTVEAAAADRVAALLREAEAGSRREPGCRHYEVSRDVANPARFLLYEVYDDEAALAAHKETAHYRDIVAAQVKPLLVDREVVTLQTLTD